MISLAHVKSSQLQDAAAVAAKRIAWPGGSITSNKEEALQKFLERKKAAEDRAAGGVVTTPTAQQSSRAKLTKHHHSPSKTGKGRVAAGHGARYTREVKPKLFKKRHMVNKQPKFVKRAGKKLHHASDDNEGSAPLPTTAKLSMSLDDIVKKKK
ncbi:hypothetical protein H310_13400 [Aphanomyces invadans]|nr:hypothetical protein H310_13400 [Aphanomyces invadans]ETV92147.1 hypothetical protein H310_13400 [Aphanomyces invadans]|eukprot:XP_008879111.1 hypothetical protein H310_13400 [Aphanomyces invadans]